MLNVWLLFGRRILKWENHDALTHMAVLNVHAWQQPRFCRYVSLTSVSSEKKGYFWRLDKRVKKRQRRGSRVKIFCTLTSVFLCAYFDVTWLKSIGWNLEHTCFLFFSSSWVDSHACAQLHRIFQSCLLMFHYVIPNRHIQIKTGLVFTTFCTFLFENPYQYEF